MRTMAVGPLAFLLGWIPLACGGGSPEPLAAPSPAGRTAVPTDSTVLTEPLAGDTTAFPTPPGLPGGDLKRLGRAPTFTPYTVRPDIKNRTMVAKALEEAYPPELREAGIQGTVHVWIFIDGEGVIQNTRIDRSSGHQGLDDAALWVARMIEFSPAVNKGTPVPVWISLPLSFVIKR